MSAKFIAVSILIAAFLIGGAIMLVEKSGSPNSGGTAGEASADNVSIVEGKQIIAISAKGGYSPRVTAAKAGIPTVIKIKTQNTFDCSFALIIPSIGWRGNLSSSGETSIDVPAQEAGTSMRGLCTMGMYNFTINFN